MNREKCDFCGQDFDNMDGVSADLDKMRNGQIISHKEMCGQCYKIVSEQLKKILANKSGQLRIYQNLKKQ